MCYAPPMADEFRQSNVSQATWIAGGGVAVFVFLAGIFVTLEQNMSGLDEREKAHTINDEKLNALMQAEIDRRMSDVAHSLSDLRMDRNQNDSNLGARIDTLAKDTNARLDSIAAVLAELQRQIALIEGHNEPFDPRPSKRPPPN